MVKRFNLRVYGLLINEHNQLLVADEAFRNGKLATKFPGGGVEFGEGIADALIREFKEETDIDVSIKEHFYTTDFFVKSFFDLEPDSQIISVYYVVESKDWNKIKTSNKKFDFVFVEGKEAESFRWIPLIEVEEETDITLPTDKVVVEKLMKKYNELQSSSQ